MPASLDVVIRPKTPVTDDTRASQRLFARVDYRREDSEEPGSRKPQQVAAAATAELDLDGQATFRLVDGVPESTVTARIETAQGLDLVVEEAKFPAEGVSAKAVISVAATVYRGTARIEPTATAQLSRTGRFTRFTDVLPEFGAHRMYVAPIRPHKIGTSNNPQTPASRALLGLTGTGDIAEFEVLDLDPAAASAADANALGLRDATLRGDGTFDFSYAVAGDEVGWLWMLLGPESWIGFQVDPASKSEGQATIILPSHVALRGHGPGGVTTPVNPGHDGGRAGENPPMDFDEGQALNNPALFADDPGTQCSPFNNPQRILGERPFFTVLRVDQPEIGGAASLEISRPIILDLAPPMRASALQAAFLADGGRIPERRDAATGAPATQPLVSRALRMAVGTDDDAARVAEARRAINATSVSSRSASWSNWIRTRLTQRAPVSPRHPIEWEGDPTLYQAGSVAGGHILEHRVQWRSNGYSLGDVAHTLSLAPRQTRRISKVSWRRRELATRREITQVTDEVSQTTLRDRDYADAVQSSLDEWSKGGSKSSTTGAAGGIGFALGPVVIGGGAAHGSASSSSWQTGGRRVAAAEQQQLRDAIRQFADSVRRLESTVVTEMSQEEEVEGISETVRNINYCHALTVLYHEILRHYRVDTAFSGVRECLFVPFSVSPFDVNKTLKWRDKLRNGMLARQLRWALDHLDEVANAWVDSDIPAGRRSLHPINYLTGSAYIQMSIERPGDREDEEAIEQAREEWTRIARLLGIPANAVIAQMKRTDIDRDAYFQREIAPTMAAKWADRLKFVVGGTPYERADFTLASSYRFGGTVRVDFTLPVDRALNRDALTSVTLRSDDALSIGSVANLMRMEFRYFTDHFDATARSVQGANDLIKPDTGAPDASGALTLFPLTVWEQQDLRRVIEDAVDQLIVHLNSNIVHYHKVIWWQMDRDELFMLLDGFVAPYGRRLEGGKWVEDTGRSIASVVEREPLGILGNSLVYRVAGGVFLGIDGHDSPAALHRYYYDGEFRPQPLRVSLPTDGLYAQALMDSCEACEEHFGSTDWVLTNDEPELEALVGQLGTRRTAPEDMTPSSLPDTLINLQNAPTAPDPTGLGGILQAVANGTAFRDMAGLAGTQANAMGALTQAAGLATSFGQMAVDFQKSKQGTSDAKQKLSNIKKAKDEGLIDETEAKKQSATALSEQNMSTAPKSLIEDVPFDQLAKQAGSTGQPVRASRQGQQGTETIEVGAFLGDGRLAQAGGLTQPVKTRCGFIDIRGSAASESTVRSTVVDVAVGEQAKWVAVAGGLIKEDDNLVFGHLVRFWCEARQVIPQDNVDAIAIAALDPATNFGHLLDVHGAPQPPIDADARRVARLLVAAVPLPGAPTNLERVVIEVLGDARASRNNKSAWSGVFVNSVVRLASDRLDIEYGDRASSDDLLELSRWGRHWEYLLAAHRRRFGCQQAGGTFDARCKRDGSYHAFTTAERVVRAGDIIVQDRQAVNRQNLLTFNGIPGLRGLEMHSDIVVDVQSDFVETIGGNVDDAVRRRRYPIDADGHLVVDARRSYIAEDDAQVFGAFPAAGAGADPVDGDSTVRIVAVLSPVEVCAAILGQPYHGGILV